MSVSPEEHRNIGSAGRPTVFCANAWFDSGYTLASADVWVPTSHIFYVEVTHDRFQRRAVSDGMRSPLTFLVDEVP